MRGATLGILLRSADGATAGQAMTTRPGTRRGGLSRRSRAKVEAFACWHSAVAQGAMAGQVGLAFAFSASRMIRRRQDYGGTGNTGACIRRRQGYGGQGRENPWR
jgi:hypothetical protein